MEKTGSMMAKSAIGTFVHSGIHVEGLGEQRMAILTRPLFQKAVMAVTESKVNQRIVSSTSRLKQPETIERTNPNAQAELWGKTKTDLVIIGLFLFKFVFSLTISFLQ